MIPEEQRDNDEKWEVLDEVPGPFLAEIVRGLLESQDIPTILRQEGVGRAVGFTVGPLGVVQIMIPAKDIERAASILEDYYAGRLAINDSFEDQSDSDDNEEDLSMGKDLI
jgi:hypothetical protein